MKDLLLFYWSAIWAVQRCLRWLCGRRFASRDRDMVPTLCGRCGWVGPLAWCVHDYEPDYSEDAGVTAIDECPECGSSDLEIDP